MYSVKWLVKWYPLKIMSSNLEFYIHSYKKEKMSLICHETCTFRLKIDSHRDTSYLIFKSQRIYLILFLLKDIKMVCVLPLTLAVPIMISRPVTVLRFQWSFIGILVS